jgi:anti-sigma regulatory factor (Ser/Thr protein kinase)
VTDHLSSPAASEPRHLLRVGPEPAHVATARRFVRGVVRGWGIEAPEDVSLLTSEAVANAVEHADSDYVVVHVNRLADCVHVAVEDADPTRPVPKPPGPNTPGGLGLHLISALAEDWGVEEIRRDGKVVWFDIALPGGDD